jgi:hypothetical protein
MLLLADDFSWFYCPTVVFFYTSSEPGTALLAPDKQLTFCHTVLADNN